MCHPWPSLYIIAAQSQCGEEKRHVTTENSEEREKGFEPQRRKGRKEENEEMGPHPTRIGNLLYFLLS
jgi:hypothetical protein